MGIRASSTFGGCLKIRGTYLGVPIIRTTVFWGLYWGPLILGNYHLGLRYWGLGVSIYAECLTVGFRT